jgi:hypothetical protein
MPILLSLANKPLCQTLSNALEISRNTAHTSLSRNTARTSLPFSNA